MIIGIGHLEGTGRRTFAILCQEELDKIGIESEICRMRVRDDMKSVILRNIDRNIVTIIPDITSLEECQMVDDLKAGCLVRMSRPGFVPGNDEAEKTMYRSHAWYDLHFLNDNSIDDLRYKAVSTAHFVKNGEFSYKKEETQ